MVYVTRTTLSESPSVFQALSRPWSNFGLTSLLQWFLNSVDLLYHITTEKLPHKHYRRQINWKDLFKCPFKQQASGRIEGFGVPWISFKYVTELFSVNK